MDLLEVREFLLDHLAGKLNLSPGTDLFSGSLPPGAPEGIALAVTGLLPRSPDNAAECTAEITGAFESERLLCKYLDQLQEIFTQPCPTGLTAWKISGVIKLENLPGESMDRCTFLLPVTVAFV